jgi:Fe-S oxidoreductase
MNLNVALRDLGRATSTCLRCLVCTYGSWPQNYPLCPLYKQHRHYAASPGGLIYLVRALVDHNASPTPMMAELAYQCTLCGACDSCEIIPISPPHVGPTEIIRFLRHQLVKEGVLTETMNQLRQKIQRNGDDLGKGFKLDVPPTVRDDDASTVLFVEGIYSQAEQNMYHSALRLLEKMGTSVALFDLEGGRCGVQLYDLGFWDELGRLLEKRTKRMKQLRDKEVLFINPHTQEFMVKKYPELVSESIQFRGRHFSEFLMDALKQGTLRVKKHKVTVSYHDPCHLSRGLGIHEAPRKVLAFLGMELIEMKRNRAETYCCGAGGGFKAFEEFSSWVASERINEFKKTGADILVTACPYCYEIFQSVLPRKEQDRVRDLIEMVDDHTQ